MARARRSASAAGNPPPSACESWISSTLDARKASQTTSTRWGELDRFGTTSPCCGALRLLLDAPASAAAVRFPWFDQLSAFFGPARLAVLRADRGPHAMLRTAVVHAVLQAETAIADLLREPPTTPTHVLLVALVVVNRRGPDNAILVALHHLRFAGGEAELGMFLLNVLTAPGLDVVGPVPAELQQEVVFTAAVAANTQAAEAAKAFIAYLKAPAAAALLSARGMTPG